MNSILLAFAASTAAHPAPASHLGNEPTAPAASADAWKSFDADLERFVASAQEGTDERVAVHGLFKATWAHLPNTTVTGDDTSGFAVDRAQLGIGGQLSEEVGYSLELEGAGGTAVVLDAFGTWKSCEYATLTFGQFRSPAVWESQLHDSELLFILRTDTGELFYTRNRGAMLSGSLDRFHWAAALQNGLDGLQEDNSYSLRAGFDVLGGGVGRRQGAYDTGRHTRLSVGAGYYDEQTEGGGSDGDVVVADAQFQLGRFAADGMIGRYRDFANPFFSDRSDSVPFNLSASFMVVEEQIEAAARFQDTDNVRHEKDFTLGVNYYLGGHGLKLQANASYIFSDLDSLDDTVRLGLGANLRI